MKRNPKWARTLAFAALVTAASIASLVAVSPALGTGPTSFSGTSSGAIVSVTNSGTGPALSASASTSAATGVIHAITAAPGSAAVRGSATSTSTTTKSYGVIGTSLNGYGVWALTSAKGWPALVAQNTALTGGAAIRGQSAGNAITGISTLANGVVGQVSATPTPAPSAIIAQAGVLGQDTSPLFHNAGVAGKSTNGIGVFAASTNGTGVEASGGSGSGVSATSGSGTGVSGSSSSGYGVEGVSTTGAGVHGTSSGNAGGFFESTNSGITGTLTIVTHSGDDNAMFVRNAATNTDLMTFDTAGNLSIKGTLVTGGSCHVGCVVIKNTAGRQLQAYTSAASVPNVEDFGQGRLVGGIGRVAINPDFASIIDSRSGYLVFITPKGDTQGWLYVTQESPSGFIVREHGMGHSTVAFDYRIVAKPFASNEARLPVWHPARLPFPGQLGSGLKTNRTGR